MPTATMTGKNTYNATFSINSLIKSYKVQTDTISAGDFVQFVNNFTFSKQGSTKIIDSVAIDNIHGVLISDTKVLLVFRQTDGAGNYYGDGYALVVNISGTNIIPGNATAIVTATGCYTTDGLTTLSEDKVLFQYTGSNGTNNLGCALVLSISGSTITPGTPIVFNNADTIWLSARALSDSKVIITYANGGNSSYGTAMILSISGTTITTNTPVVYSSGVTSYNTLAVLNDNKVVVGYSVYQSSYYGTAVVLTISGNTISVGTPVVFKSSATDTIYVTALSDTKVIAVFRDTGNGSYATAVAMSISGTTLTVGSPLVYKSSETYFQISFSLSETKIITFFSDNGNSMYGNYCILSVSGTTVTASTPVVYSSTNVYYPPAVLLLPDNRVFVAYTDRNNSSFCTCLLLTPEKEIVKKVSATKVGSKLIRNEEVHWFSAVAISDKKVLATFQQTSTGYGIAVILSIVGNSIIQGTPVVFKSSAISHISVCTLSDSKCLVVFRDVTNSGYGTAVCLSVSGTTISAGSPLVFSSSSAYISAVSTVDNVAFVAYQNIGNSNYGTVIGLSIFGTTISAGTAVVFSSASTGFISIVSLSVRKFLISFSNTDSNNYGTAVVITVSGTTITLGSSVGFSYYTAYIALTALSDSKALVVYQDAGNGNRGTAIVISISGTTPTKGTAVIFADTVASTFSIYSVSDVKVIVCYKDSTDSSKGKVLSLDIVGTTITYDKSLTFNSLSTSDIDVVMVSENKFVAVYTNVGNSNFGYADIMLLTHCLGVAKSSASSGNYIDVYCST